MTHLINSLFSWVIIQSKCPLSSVRSGVVSLNCLFYPTFSFISYVTKRSVKSSHFAWKIAEVFNWWTVVWLINRLFQLRFLDIINVLISLEHWHSPLFIIYRYLVYAGEKNLNEVKLFFFLIISVFTQSCTLENDHNSE